MENISIQILRICIIVCVTEFQTGQLILVPEPCPGFAPRATIVDMCTTDFATEESTNGGTKTDSVALRVMTQQNGCTCEVSLQNQYNTHVIYMRRYDNLKSASPEEESCGLAIQIVYTIPNNVPENKDSIRCTKGINSRSFSLSQNGVLNLRSKIVGGNFSRGYCIQIYRQHTTGDNKRIQINCSLSYMQTTQQDKTLSSNMPTIQQDKTISSNMQTTQHMTDVEIQDDTTGQIGDAAIEDKTVSDTDSTLYIAIGVVSAVVIALIVLVTIIIIIRRKDNTNTNGIEVQPDIDSNDDDSDGLKYNCLYNASEQQDIMEGDYHTVELEGKQNRTGTHNLDSDYSTVGGNYSSVDIVNMPLHEGTKSDSNIQSTPTTSPKSEIQRTEEATSNNLKHVTAGINAEYAIVNKSKKTDQNIKHVTAPDDSNVEYAIVDKKKCINN